MIRTIAILKCASIQAVFLGMSICVGSSAFAASTLPSCPWIGKRDNCFGEQVMSDGRLYTGEFRNGKRHGKGVVTYKDGFKYVGSFADDMYEGTGELYVPPGWVYSGEFVRGRFQGSGKLTVPDGKSYTGEFKADNFDGFGTLTFPDGKKYVGNFKNDQYEGEGTEYRADGTVIRSGIWDAGLYVDPNSLATQVAATTQSDNKAIAQQQLLASAQAKALADARAQIEAQAKTEAQSKAFAEAQAKALAEAQAMAQIEARARVKAEAQAKALADAQSLAPSENIGAAIEGPKLKSIALVIGNSNYSAFAKLPNPRNDARAIAEKLRSFGIEVDLVLDADRGALVNALNNYQTKAAGRDVNIFYYAGHGLQINGVNYLIPTDMRADGLSAGYIKLNGVSVNDAMDYLPSKTRLVFLDACRDNPASRSLVASRGAGAVGLAPINAPSGTLVSYATKEGTTAEDGNGQNSPFTTALLENLDAKQDIGIVLRKVRRRVLELTHGQQEPWEYGSLTGDQLIVSTMSR